MSSRRTRLVATIAGMLVAALLRPLHAQTTPGPTPATPATPPAAPAVPAAAPTAPGGPPVLVIPAAAQPVNGHLDVTAATNAYLAMLTPEQKQRSDSYFEGGYWIQLWEFIVTVLVLLLLLGAGWSARVRDAIAQKARSNTLGTFLYALWFILSFSIITFPLAVYTDFVREHAYGLSNLTFGGWLVEQLKGLGISLVFGGLLITAIYAVVRRTPQRWWMWSAGVMVLFLFVVSVITPVFLVPIFNTTTKLTDQRVVAPILRMARANGIEATDVWEIDASKQSKRMSANVSGALGTERITLNDNLLNRAPLEEIEAVMGHEMGHYVLNHVYKGFLELALVIVFGFAFVSWAFERLRMRYPKWGIRDVTDVAGLPLGILLFATYLFVMTPVLNTIVRTGEYEADVFGLNAARQPDGFARAALDLSEYRKLEPSSWEERIFYDHPSGRTRIFTAMRWKAEEQ